MTKAYLLEILNDHDVKTLEELSICMLNIWSKEIEEKKRKKVYDNTTLDAFMAELTIMIEDIIRSKKITDYISHIHGARFVVEVPIING